MYGRLHGDLKGIGGVYGRKPGVMPATADAANSNYWVDGAAILLSMIHMIAFSFILFIERCGPDAIWGRGLNGDAVIVICGGCVVCAWRAVEFNSFSVAPGCSNPVSPFTGVPPVLYNRDVGYEVCRT